jgi:hypothetical protein
LCSRVTDSPSPLSLLASDTSMDVAATEVLYLSPVSLTFSTWQMQLLEEPMALCETSDSVIGIGIGSASSAILSSSASDHIARLVGSAVASDTSHGFFIVVYFSWWFLLFYRDVYYYLECKRLYWSGIEWSVKTGLKWLVWW